MGSVALLLTDRISRLARRLHEAFRVRNSSPGHRPVNLTPAHGPATDRFRPGQQDHTDSPPRHRVGRSLIPQAVARPAGHPLRRLASRWGGPFVLGLSLLFCAATRAVADEAPQATYRGIAWGTPVLEAIRILETKDQSITCPAEFRTLDKFQCDGVLMVGDVVARNMVFFEQARMAGVVMVFDSKDFEFIRAVFVQKFGEAKVADKAIVQNLAGASADAAGLLWSWPDAKVVLMERGATMTKGMAVLGPPGWFDRFMKPDQDRVKKGVGDF